MSVRHSNENRRASLLRGKADNEMKLAKMEINSLRSRRLCVLCVFVGLITHDQQVRELSMCNEAKENAEDAETPRTLRAHHAASFNDLNHVQ
jgi:hypothetical protein